MDAKRSNIITLFFLKTLTLLTLLSAATGVAQTANLRPVLPLESSAKELPLFEEGLRDPSLVKRTPSDDLGIEQLDQEIQELESDLRNAKGSRRSEVLEELYGAYVIKAYFYADAAAGKTVSVNPANKQPASLRNARQAVVRYATAFAKDNKNNRKKGRALFHVFTAKYLMGQSKAASVKGLNRIAKYLPRGLKRRVEYLNAMHEVQYGNRAAGTAALTKLIGRLPKEGAIAARLAVARSFAGLNRNGGKVTGADQKYRTHLYHATKQASSFNKERKEAVLSFAVAVWRRAEGKNTGWDKVPLYSRGYKDNLAFDAITERRAILAARQGKIDLAVKQYRALSYKYEGVVYMVEFDKRIADLNYLKFKKQKNLTAYEKTLLSLSVKYDDPEILGGGKQELVKKTREDFVSRYKAFVYAVMATAGKPSTTPAFRKQAITVASNYRTQVKDGEERRNLDAKIAQLYALNKQHREAVSIYRELIQSSQGVEKRKFLALAMTSQHILAKWPSKAPWNGIKAGPTSDRALLADFYGQMHELNGKNVEWPTVAQLGLLYINIGQAPKAFDLWTKTLEVASSAADARQAAGMMLVAYDKARDWDNLEKVADLCLSKGIKPMHGKRAIDAKQYLANALFFGGKEAYAAQNYDKATEKLKRFTETFKNEPRRPEALYVLAFSYRGNGQHLEGVQTLVVLVETYPKSKFIHPALLHGGEWSIPMALEEQAIFFYQRFLKVFPKDEKADQVREILAQVYLGRELYGNASQIYKEQAEAKTSAANKARAARRYLEIEEKFGDDARATAAAKQLLSVAQSDADRAMALSYLSRRTENIVQLNKYQNQLAALDPSQEGIIDGVAEIRFRIAEKNASRTKAEIFNLGLKDPIATLNKHYSYFKQSQLEYMKVCEVGENQFCAPAMSRLARITQNTIQTIEDLTIPESLDAGTVVKFNERKQQIIGQLADTAEASDSRSAEIVKSGHTMPEWAEEINWNTSDNSVQRTVHDTGNSFVQWNPADAAAAE